MCQYKPCVLWFHLNTLVGVLMIVFCMLMWMYIGDYYPSFRFQFSWYWSLLQYMYSASTTVICSIMLYKEIPNKGLNRLCLSALLGGVLSSIVLTGLTWPEMTKNEFENFVYDYFEQEQMVPRFMEYFQSRHICCGITNYTDYIFLNGTRVIQLRSGVRIAVFDVPRSCCFTASQRNRACGRGISLKNATEITSKLNTDTVGCYAKFRSIVYEGAPFQITVLHDILRTIPATQIVYLSILIGIYWWYYRKQINRLEGSEAGDHKFTAKLARLI